MFGIKDFIEKIKQIDLSDKRLFVVAFVLFIIPPIIFINNLIIFPKSSDQVLRESSTSFTQIQGVQTKKGFSFIRQPLTSSEIGMPSIRGSRFISPSIETEWKEATLQIEQEKVQIPDIPGISPIGKKMLEAEFNQELRISQELYDQGKFKECIPILIDIINSSDDNPFLKAVASSNLCAVYEQLGMQAELDSEFRRLVDFIEKIPPNSGFGAKLLDGLRALAQQKELLSKAALSAENRDFLQKMLIERGLSEVHSPESYAKAAVEILTENIPGLNLFKSN